MIRGQPVRIPKIQHEFYIAIRQHELLYGGTKKDQ